MGDQVYRTEPTTEKNRDPILNYCHHHTVDVVTTFLLDYLQNDKLTIRIYGTQDLVKKGGKDRSQIDSSLNASSSTADNSRVGA